MNQLIIFTIGSVGLLLIGFNTLSEALQFYYPFQFSHNKLNKVTSSFYLGFKASLFSPSSFSLSNNSVSYLMSGLFNSSQAYFFFIGSLFGSAIIPFAFSFQPQAISLFFTGIGAIIFFTTNDPDIKNIAKLFFSCGLIYFSLLILAGGAGEGLFIRGSVEQIYNQTLPPTIKLLLGIGVVFAGLMFSIAAQSQLVFVVLLGSLYSMNFISEALVFNFLSGVVVAPYFSNLFDWLMIRQKKMKPYVLSKFIIGVLLLVFIHSVLFNFVINVSLLADNLSIRLLGGFGIQTGFFVAILFFVLTLISMIFSVLLFPLYLKLYTQLDCVKQKLPQKILHLGLDTDMTLPLAINQGLSEVAKSCSLLQSMVQLLVHDAQVKGYEQTVLDKLTKYKNINAQFYIEMNQFILQIQKQKLTFKEAQVLQRLQQIVYNLNQMFQNVYSLSQLLKGRLESKDSNVSKILYQLENYFIAFFEDTLTDNFYTKSILSLKQELVEVNGSLEQDRDLKVNVRVAKLLDLIHRTN